MLKRFLRFLVLWTGGLTLLLLLSGLAEPDSPWSLWARLPGMAVFALILACFPAGIAVGGRVFSHPRTFARDGAGLLLATLLLVALTFLLLQYAVPTALAGHRIVGRGDVVELREMTAPELRAYGRPLVEAAEQAPRGELAAWSAANAFAFEHERRLAHASLPFFLTWLGALVGPWARRIRHREARIAQLLGQGMVLATGIYLGGENGYELVAQRAAGQAYFAAWFIVFVPAVLGAGLGWPTLVHLYTDPVDVGEPPRPPAPSS